MPIIQNVMTDAFSLHESDSKSSGLPRTLGEQIAARQRALEEIDRAQFGWYHVRAIMVAGSGFFTDAYDIFSINVVSTMLGYVYYRNATNKGIIPGNLDEALKVGTSAGAIVGQIAFGMLCDKLGRKKMYGVSILIMIFATIATALSGEGPVSSAVGVIVFWRVVLGLGVGGDYPMAAVITSEFASTRYRGRMMAAVFSMQGFGIIMGALVFYFSLLASKSAILYEQANIPLPTDPTAPSAGLPSVDRVWRLVVGFGCVPAVISLYYRLTIPETPRYTIDIERDILQGEEDVEGFLNNEWPHGKDRNAVHPELDITPKASRRDFFFHFRQWQYGKVLLGTAGSWFFIDIAFYGLGLNNSIILQTIGFTNPNPQEVYEILYNVAVRNVIIQCAGTMPGYFFSIVFIDMIGRKRLQLCSFGILTLIFAILGFAYGPLTSQKSNQAGFITMLVFCQFFMNFGANTTTFIIPGEVFPTRYRTTAHGISAAFGKLGAIIAQVLFNRFNETGGESTNLNHVLEIFAALMICGFLLTLLVPETKNKTLEELSGENDEDSMRRNFQENRRQKEIEMMHRAERLSQMERPPAARRSHLREENGGEKWGVGTSGRSGI